MYLNRWLDYLSQHWLSGRIVMFTNSGRGVITSVTDQVMQSADASSVTTFLLVPCRAWNVMSESLRRRCVSLMDANRTDWFVSLYSNQLRVEQDEPDEESSFILHVDAFFPGYYALESVRKVPYYVYVNSNGYLYIGADQPTAVTYKRSASFKLFAFDTFRTYCFLLRTRQHIWCLF